MADVHRAPMLSPFDAYVAGLTNIEVSHPGTLYAGTYGPPLHDGLSPPGLFGHNYRSDRRQHGACFLTCVRGLQHCLRPMLPMFSGNMTLSPEVADELAAKFAESHWVEYKHAKLFVESPVCTRGVPHGLIPGIHSSLDRLVDGLEALRVLNNRENSMTVDVVASLAFSPWTQAIAPTIEFLADLSMRLCVREPSLLATGSGKAYLPDSTDPERALMRPPLLAGPVQVSMADNPFATSYEHIDSFFNCANTIVLFARMATTNKKKDPIERLHKIVDGWVTGSRTLSPQNCLLAADVLVLLSCMYPSTWRIAEPCVQLTWAKALPKVAARIEAEMAEYDDDNDHKITNQKQFALENLGLDSELLEAGRVWWGKFSRKNQHVCAWKSGIAPLLTALHDHDGSHAVTKRMVGDMRLCLEMAVRAGFLVASEDGVTPPPAPCPASTAQSAARVKRPHVDPVFVGDVTKGVDATGCLVGLKPHQLRQVVTLQMGAHLKDVKVQVSRNEGVFFSAFFYTHTHYYY